MNADRRSISFPPRSIADEPLRLTLLWNTDAGLALNKHAGLAAFQDSRLGGGPRSILNEIVRRTEAGASQFQRLGIERLSAINLLDREASGVLLMAKTHEAKAELKNAMGSSQFSFRYRFLSAGKVESDELECDLPVAVHRRKPLALISHRTGKKASTVFRRIEDFGACSLWESDSSYDRYHQVRLHAQEVGIPLVADPIYQAKEEPRPVAGIARPILHLHSLRFPLDGEAVTIEAPYPRALRAVLKRFASPGADR